MIPPTHHPGQAGATDAATVLPGAVIDAGERRDRQDRRDRRDRPDRLGRWRRRIPWIVLSLLLAVAQGLLVALTINFESNRAQQLADAAASEAAADVRSLVLRAIQDLQLLDPGTEREHWGERWRERARGVLADWREIVSIERSGEGVPSGGSVVVAPNAAALAGRGEGRAQVGETREACALARRENAPIFSRSYFAPSDTGVGAELIDLCLPLQAQGRDQGFLIATFSLGQWLESALAGLSSLRHRHEISFIESDGARLARAGTHRGAGIFVAESVVDLPGRAIRLRADSVEGRPSLLPNVTVALVLGLSVALTTMVLVLARDVRRRERAEAALGEALAIRRAMEDSLPTGLRARDLEGRVTYVNPAFCKMVGFPAEALLGHTTPPYWPPEDIAVYAARQPPRIGPRSATDADASGPRGFETRFMRRDGERFPVMVYEAPLVDGQGRHAGWMSAVLDISEQRRVEDLSRLQQERMQATARLATVGEMASLLSHELNQPLSAIASYAAGSLNLLDDPDPQLVPMLREALERMAAQAERAGQVIRSVHDFVRRRAQDHERVPVDVLVQSVLPLVQMQARKSGARIETEMPAEVPAVRCDRTMMEQVLLNLARNGLQAMEQGTAPAERVLRIEVRCNAPRWVSFAVVDAGTGIAPEVAPRLFTPFFTTRDEGMGLGLSLCRTVVELHGGALDFESPRPDRPPGVSWAGSRFRFTLPTS